ncbi:MAG: hypothetical protein M3365_03015, partial [Gemmatimonadota bacterium]|nr:hypothetical protein [Gemmatimonadota bacterium]
IIPPNDMRTVAARLGAASLLAGRIRRRGDSLEMEASVFDAATSETRPAATRRFSERSLLDVESRIAADVAGALFRSGIPGLRRVRGHTIDPESYRLTLEGLHELNADFAPVERGSGARPRAAGDLFNRAVEIDHTNAAAWAGLSSVWGSLAVADQIPFDEGYDRSSAAAMRAIDIDSTQGLAWANLGMMRAMKHQNLAAGIPLFRKAEAAEPSNAAIFRVKNALLRSAHRWDQARDAARIARQLDPLTSNYVDREAVTELCANRPEAALELYRSELALDRSDRLARSGLTRSLARLGRYDEALASWREGALAAGDSALATSLAVARGAQGYWRLKHEEGRHRLQLLKGRPGYISPVRFMQAYWAAGDVDAGFQALERAGLTDTRALYRLPCLPEADEIRNTPRFRAALARIQALPER